MKMKTNELTGAALDWAVAKCEGWIDDCNGWLYQATLQEVAEGNYKPSTDWAQGGQIVEENNISIICMSTGHWGAHPVIGDHPFIYGNTPLIAAMRCYVASKLGDEVDVPEEVK